MPRLAPSYEGRALATLSLRYTYPSAGSRSALDFASIHSSPPWKDLDNPTIVEHDFGRGNSIYSVVPIETDTTAAGRLTFTGLINYLLREPATLSSGASPDVWLTAFDQPQHRRVVISAVCYRIDARPEPFRLVHISLAIEHQPDGVRLAPSGSDMPFASADGAVAVALDGVDLSAMFLLECQTT